MEFVSNGIRLLFYFHLARLQWHGNIHFSIKSKFWENTSIIHPFPSWHIIYSQQFTFFFCRLHLIVFVFFFLSNWKQPINWNMIRYLIQITWITQSKRTKKDINMNWSRADFLAQAANVEHYLSNGGNDIFSLNTILRRFSLEINVIPEQL